MDQPTLPLPSSGSLSFVAAGANKFDIIVTGINKSDHDLLMGFFLQMHGRVGKFRVIQGNTVHEHCRFGADSAPFSKVGQNTYDVTLPIAIDVWAVKNAGANPE